MQKPLKFKKNRYFLQTFAIVLAIGLVPYIQKTFWVLGQFSQKWLSLVSLGNSWNRATIEALSYLESSKAKIEPYFIHRVSAASPTCSITAPSAGATVSSSVSVSASASGSSPISVQFHLDGANLGSADSSSPYGINWNTTAASEGSHSLSCTTTNQYGETTTGNSVSVTVDNSAPVRSNGQPSAVLASGTTSANLQLTTNENATCKYSTSSGTAYASMPNTFSTSGGTSQATTVTGLADGQSYAYYVRCQDQAGNINSSDFSISFSVAVASGDTEAPSIPNGLTATAESATSISLSWNASTDDTAVAGYKIYRDAVQIATTSGTTYVDANLNANTSYVYTIAAYDAAANTSGLSAEAFANTLSDNIAPSIPQNISANALSQSSISLNWNASSDNVGVAGYKIYRGGEEIGVTTNTSYLDSDLYASTSYEYSVLAFDFAQNMSSNSSVVTVSTPAAPEEESKNKSEKKQEKPKMVLKNSSSKLTNGQILTQSGKRFPKNEWIALYFQGEGGKYYPPTLVKTDSRGRFSIQYKVNKAVGKYKWYAKALKSGKKSDKISYRVYASTADVKSAKKSSSSSRATTKTS